MRKKRFTFACAATRTADGAVTASFLGRLQLAKPQVQTRQRPQAQQRDRQERGEVICERVTHREARIHAIDRQRDAGRRLEHAHEPRRRGHRDAEPDDPLEQQRGFERQRQPECAEAHRERRGVHEPQHQGPQHDAREPRGAPQQRAADHDPIGPMDEPLRAASRSHSTRDHSTTPANRAGLFSTARPTTIPSAQWMSRSATRAGNRRRTIRPNNASQGTGRWTTTSANSSRPPNRSAAVVVSADTERPPTTVWAGNDGAPIATAIRPNITSPSNTRSTPTDASAVVNRTGSWRPTT